MINVRVFEDAIEIKGHASDKNCCAAVSAAVQTVLCYFDLMGHDMSDIVEPYEDHGGYTLIHLDKIVGWDIVFFIALVRTIEEQAKAWPGEIEVTRMHDWYSGWYAEGEEN